MNELLPQLLQNMHASRAALAQQLDQVTGSHPLRPTTTQKPNVTPQGIGIVVGVAVAIAVLFPARRRR